jgi:peptide subunit release factor 1 (eRF1)
MEPKLKAKEIVEKFKNDLFKQRGVTIYTEDAILCALIAVDEIIEELLECGEVWMKSRIIYWQEVKQEIEKL